MMEWAVAKMGRNLADAAQAYGLAIVLNYASDAPVTFWDDGLVYSGQGTGELSPEINCLELLERVLALPDVEELQIDKFNLAQASAKMANLDGLLAVLFTTPGIRLVSVADLLDQKKRKPKSSCVKDGLDKARTAIDRCRKYIEQVSHNPSNWLLEALQDYAPSNPTIPFITPARKGDLAIQMTIDPSFSYSTYRSLNDGLITNKIGVTVQGTKYAVVFILIGAVYFLQAQRTANDFVNFYLPLPHLVTIQKETRLPLLASTIVPSNQAIASKWLDYSKPSHLSDMDWKGLAYQTLQPQGPLQSISIGCGCLDNDWLNSIKKQLGLKMTNYWGLLLSYPPEKLSYQIESLMDCFSKRDQATWFNHLYELAIASCDHPQSRLRSYTLEEIKEVTKFMTPPKNAPSLSSILEREEGTLRFGRALHSLELGNNAALIKIIVSLDRVKTDEQLIRIAGEIAQECEVAAARSDFIVVPKRIDLQYLLDDIGHFGLQKIAKLLISLAFVRHPRDDHQNRKQSSNQSIEEGQE